MKGTEQLLTAVRAGYCYFYGQTDEISRSVEQIQQVFAEYKNNDTPIWQTIIWDFETNEDPDSLLDILRNSAENASTGKTLVIAKNYHWFLMDQYKTFDKRIATFFQNNSETFSSPEFRTAVIILGDVAFDDAIPDCLSKEFLPLEFSLPDAKEIEAILDVIIDSVKDDKKFKRPTKAVKTSLIRAAQGMTAREVKNSFAYSLIEDQGKFVPLTVSRLKAKDIEKTPGLTYKEYPKDIEIIGFEEAKDFTLNSYNDPDALGCIFVGPPGTGKTMFCKWLGSKTGLPVIEWELAQMMGEGLVGQAENAMRRGLEVAKANAPCVLFFDEIEKGLAGSSKKSGVTDGGTSKRSNSQLLKFLSDERPKGVYILATCNDVTSVDPEWLRAGRWDCAPWYVGLPNEKTRQAILEHYKKIYKVQGQPTSMEGWSGAEIEAVCKTAKLLKRKIEDVEKFIIPISVTMDREISELERWSKGRTNPVDIIPVRQKRAKSKNSRSRKGIEL